MSLLDDDIFGDSEQIVFRKKAAAVNARTRRQKKETLGSRLEDYDIGRCQNDRDPVSGQRFIDMTGSTLSSVVSLPDGTCINRKNFTDFLTRNEFPETDADVDTMDQKSEAETDENVKSEPEKGPPLPPSGGKKNTPAENREEANKMAEFLEGLKKTGFEANKVFEEMKQGSRKLKKSKNDRMGLNQSFDKFEKMAKAYGWGKYYAKKGVKLAEVMQMIHNDDIQNDTFSKDDCVFLYDSDKYRSEEGGSSNQPVLMSMCMPKFKDEDCTLRICFDAERVVREKPAKPLRQEKRMRYDPLTQRLSEDDVSIYPNPLLYAAREEVERRHKDVDSQDRRLSLIDNLVDEVDDTFYELVQLHVDIYKEGQNNKFLQMDLSDLFFTNLIKPMLGGLIEKFPIVAKVGSVFKYPRDVAKRMAAFVSGTKLDEHGKPIQVSASFFSSFGYFKILLPLFSKCMKTALCLAVSGLDQAEIDAALNRLLEGFIGPTLKAFVIGVIKTIYSCFRSLANPVAGPLACLSQAALNAGFGGVTRLLDLLRQGVLYLLREILVTIVSYFPFGDTITGVVDKLKGYLGTTYPSEAICYFTGYECKNARDRGIEYTIDNDEVMKEFVAQANSAFYVGLFLFVLDKIPMSLVGKLLKQVIDGLIAALKALGVAGGTVTAATGVGALAGIALVKALDVVSGLGDAVHRMAERGETLKAFVMYGMRLVQEAITDSAHFYMLVLEAREWLSIFWCALKRFLSRLYRIVVPQIGVSLEMNPAGSEGGPVACCTRDLINSISEISARTEFSANTGGAFGRAFSQVRSKLFGSSAAPPSKMLSVNLVCSDDDDDDDQKCFKFDAKEQTKRLEKILKQRALMMS